MAETRDPQAFLDACGVTPDVFELRPDYRAQLLVIQGLDPTGSQVADTGAVDELILAAEEHARRLTEETAVTDLAHINAWREAYRAFGAKPQRTRNSLEALTRRAQNGLPRVNALTDIYNAISVLHQLPLGGEDFQHYEGPARLTRAAGEEPFDTSANGETVIEHPEPGEVIWGDVSSLELAAMPSHRPVGRDHQRPVHPGRALRRHR